MSETETPGIQNLFSLGVDPDSFTVFGYSCGSWTAHQIGTIFSETIKGQTLCNGGLAFGGYQDTQAAIDLVDEYSTSTPQKMQSTDNLIDKPIYIWSGEQDQTIPTVNQEQQQEFYVHYDAKVSFNEGDIGHNFENTTFQDGLDYHYKEFVDSYENMKPGVDTWSTDGVLLQFDQQEFTPIPADLIPDRNATGIADVGYFYYPKTCIGEDKKCKFAMVFTGGGMNQTSMIEQGFVQTAAANDIVLLFPQQALEFHACFDNNADYTVNANTEHGTQSLVFKAMWERMMKPQNATEYDYEVEGLDSDDLDSSNLAWMIAALVGVFLFLCVCFTCIYKKCQKRSADKVEFAKTEKITRDSSDFQTFLDEKE